MLSAALITAREHLDSLGMGVTQEWLVGCVEFFCEGLNNKPLNKQELCTMVTNQWILGDLQEISPGCLPPDLSGQIKTTLNGTYTLQMMSLLDIGTPAYQQLQKILKIDTQNVEINDNPNHQEISMQRILKLTLTDGNQIISGLEYKPMRNLNINLTPGIKLQIKGPVDSRRGVLMLEEKHVTILGGEVDDLLESNSYKNILIKIVEKNNNLGDNVSTFTRESIETRIVQPTHVNSNPHGNVNVVRPNNMIEPSNVELNEETFNDDNFDLMELENIEHQAIAQTASSNPVVRNNPNDYIDLDSILMNEPEDEPDQIQTYPIKVNILPYIYIKQLANIPDRLKLNKTYTVKAQIIKVVGKLTIQKNNWILKCEIWDGSESMDVDFSSDFLSPLIGYTPEEMAKLKKQMSTNPDLKQKILAALENSMNKIRNFDCLFHITFRDNGPYIVKTEQMTKHHITQLKDRHSAINF